VAREVGQGVRVQAGLDGHRLVSAVGHLVQVWVKAWAWALL
jgi:hypothetical protein